MAMVSHVFPELLETPELSMEQRNTNKRNYYICQKGNNRKCRKVCVKWNKFVALEYSTSNIVSDNCV